MPAHAAPPEKPANTSAAAGVETIVVIAVADVQQAEGGPVCTVKGQVRQVEKGRALGIGQNVVLTVPCHKPGGKPRAGSVALDAGLLTAAPYGRAQLDAAGTELRARYEPLAEPPPPPSVE
ncbi:hypothetical protein ACLBXM_11035 [Xanthobacteraceae bacterium A53D]